MVGGCGGRAFYLLSQGKLSECGLGHVEIGESLSDAPDSHSCHYNYRGSVTFFSRADVLLVGGHRLVTDMQSLEEDRSEMSGAWLGKSLPTLLF